MKIGLLASDSLPEFRQNTLRPILQDDSLVIEVAVIDQRAEETLTQRLKRNLRLGRGGYVLVMGLKRILARPSRDISTRAFCASNDIDVIEAVDPYSDQTVARLKEYDLDVLLLVGGFGIVKEPFLSMTPMGVLSYHHGNMRTYRGAPPVFWELYNGEKEIGVTLQILDVGLDCGVCVDEKTIDIRPRDTLSSLQSRVFGESEDMMYLALKKMMKPDFGPTRVEALGKVYTQPNLRQWTAFNAKMLWRKVGPCKGDDRACVPETR